MFGSNYLGSDLFNRDMLEFAVWFIMSVFTFSCGWIITRTFGWVRGGKMVFAAIVSTASISIIMIVLFKDYFDAAGLLTENLILYSLRNIFLGAMAFFGMTVAELFDVQKKLESYEILDKSKDEIVNQAKEKAQLIIDKAKHESEKLVTNAGNKAKDLIEERKRIENQLKEFIEIETELLDKYKTEENH